jgi:NADH-quinone oxidoreductase subunit L
MDPSSSFYLLDKVWLFPAIMAASFLLILFVGKRLPEKATAGIGIAAVSICFALSLLTGAQWINRVNHPPEGAAMAAAEQACGVGGAEAEGAETGEHGVTGTAGEHHAGLRAQEQPGGGEGQGETTPENNAPGSVGTEGQTHGETTEAEHEAVVPVCKTITWFTLGGRDFEAGTVLDGLSALMLFTVGLVSMLVHIYSTEYLHDDRRFTHYYAFLSLFTASMLFYVLGSNTLQMLVGWELVGLCSFALIGHWWEEKPNSDAALKAFLTNRVGDTGLIIGVIVTFFAAGATSFNVFHLNEFALKKENLGAGLLVIGALCLFAGVTSKSGQFPLHTWLPDAMAGPTPVSALIHAATMVVAGVYLIARLYGVFFSGLHIGSGILLGHDPSTYLNWVAIAAGLTTLVGGTLAFVQHDLKKVLAYSTVSQLGYMVMGLGVGAWTGAVFHLFTHAMFKACLFLGAGSVSHACHHTFDMREMGGLRKKMPVTFYTFVVGSAALAGIPLLSGFWSKDEILAGALQNGYLPIFAMGITTALLTAAYTTRAVYLTFFGEYRGHAHPHESPKVITVPLVILAAFAFLLVLANIPNFGTWIPGAAALRFEHFVQPTFAFPPEGAPPTGLPVVPFNVPLAFVSVVLAVVGIGGMWWYQTSNAFRGLTTRVGLLRGGYTVLVEKYYLDWLYTDVIVRFTKTRLAQASYWANMKIIDAIVNAAGVTARFAGGLVYRFVDQGFVDRVVNFSGQASEGSGQFLRRSQSGKVQEYASLLFGSAVVFVIALVLVIRLSA